MKPRRTSLPSDAATGGVRARSAPTPTPLVDADPSPSAALRERLTQTRARMARRLPQISIDWDPEELPTRRYQGESLFAPRRNPQQEQASPRARTRLGSGEVPIGSHFDEAADVEAPASEALDPWAFPSGPGYADDTRPGERVRSCEVPVATDPVQQLPARRRAQSGEVLVGSHFGEASYVEPHASDALDPATFPGARPQRRVRDALATPPRVQLRPAAHIAPIADTPTREAFSTLLLREVSAVAQHLQGLYDRIDRSERALRNRVAICSGGLLLVAAGSLFFSHSRSENTDSQPAAAIAPQALPRTASVRVSSDPPGAHIFVDGQASGKVTPASIAELTPGKHRIGLRLAGYTEATEALRLPEDALLSIKLAPLSAPRIVSRALENRPQTRAEARAQARALARERRAAVRASRVISRYRARMGLPAEPADEPTQNPER